MCEGLTSPNVRVNEQKSLRLRLINVLLQPSVQLLCPTQHPTASASPEASTFSARFLAAKMEMEAQKSTFFFFISSSSDAPGSTVIAAFPGSRWKEKCGNAEVIMFESALGQQAWNVIVSAVH